MLFRVQDDKAALDDNFKFFLKLNICLPYDLAIPPGHLPWRNRHMRHTKMFIVALFVIAPKQKQFKCSSVDEWISKLVLLRH